MNAFLCAWFLFCRLIPNGNQTPMLDAALTASAVYQGLMFLKSILKKDDR